MLCHYLAVRVQLKPFLFSQLNLARCYMNLQFTYFRIAMDMSSPLVIVNSH